VQIVKRDAREGGHVKEQIASAVGSDEPKSTIGFFLDCTFGHLTLSSSSPLSSTLPQPPRFHGKASTPCVGLVMSTAER
jgi:hypothetical protein